MANNKPKVDTSGIQADLTKSITNAITEGFKTAGAAFSSLSSDISKAVTDGFKHGSNKSKKYLEGKTLLESMNAELESINKQEKESAISAQVRNLVIDQGISIREAELQIINDQYQATASNVEEQFKLNKALGLAEYAQAKARGDIEGMLKIRKDLLQLGIENKASGFSANEAKETEEANNQLQAKIKLGRILEEQDKKKQAVIDKMKEVKKGLLDQLGITGKIIDQSKTPEMAKAIFAEEMTRKIDEASEAFDGFRKQGLSAGQAVGATFKSMSIASAFGFSDAAGVMTGVIEQYGVVNALSGDAVDSLGKMAHEFGITGQEALKLNATLSEMPGETTETATQAMKVTGEMAKLNGIAPGKIMKDMAANSSLLALGGYKSAEAFGKAAIQAHKMGVDLKTTEGVMSSLLDFEGSINKQMEASVLLGREINLDKARELALQGKSVEATAEVLKQAGGEAAFSKMNILQKQALAAATGMTVEQLQKANDAQKEQNKYFGEGAAWYESLLGYGKEYVSGIGGFLKENGLLLLSFGQLAATLSLKTAATVTDTLIMNFELVAWIKSAAGKVWDTICTVASTVAKGAWSLITTAGITIMNFELVAWIKSAAGKVWDTTCTVASTVAKGAWNLVTTAGNLIMKSGIVAWIASAAGKVWDTTCTVANTVARWLGIASKGTETGTNILLADSNLLVGKTATPAASGMTALAAGMMALYPAIPVILALGLAILLITPALYVIGEVIKSIATVIGNVLIKALEMLPAIIGAVADGFVTIFDTLAANWKILIPVGIGMVALAFGVSALGISFYGATPGLILGAIALTLLAIPLTIIASDLMLVAEAAPALATVGTAMVAIGTGLATMGGKGLLALPIIGALIGLAAVAPALSSLSSIFGGGEEKEDKEDPIAIVIAKIDQLIAVASGGGTINMDGKKVGEIVRASWNTTGVS